MKPTVLCVDDLEEVLANYRTHLEEDFNVVTVNNGADALAYVREHQVDAVLMDRALGAEDGIRVIKEMRKLGIEVPIAVCSDYKSNISTMAAEMAGATGYVGKNDYVGFLREHLGGS